MYSFSKTHHHIFYTSGSVERTKSFFFFDFTSFFLTSRKLQLKLVSSLLIGWLPTMPQKQQSFKVIVKFPRQNYQENIKLSRCASCVARCIPPCDLCAYFRNLQGQTISSWDSCVLMCLPNNFNSFKIVWPKKILVNVIGTSQILIQKKMPFPGIENLSKIIHFE